MSSNSKYRDLSSDGHDGDDRSSIEVGIPLIGDAEKYLHRETEDNRRNNIKPSNRATRFLHSYRWLLDTFLLIIILCLLVEIRLQRHRNEYEMSGDLTGFAPRFSQQIVQFKEDSRFSPENTSEFFTGAVQQNWIDLVPKGLGYIKMDNPKDYNNLPTPLPEYKTKNTTVFTTSMTHQLHCLHAIVKEYSAMSTNNTEQMRPKRSWHIKHCFEYLRQSIMCCGDVALEGMETTFPNGVRGSDGWDAKHVCKDYNQVHDYLEEQRANDRAWI